MKTFLNLATALMSLIFLSSCGKDDCYTYSGRILSYGTKTPVADASVQIIAGKAVGLFEPVIEWITDSVRTDAEGRWKITVTQGDYHKIGPIIKEGYFSDLSFEPRAQLYSLSESGPLSNQDYIIDPKGMLHVIIFDDPNYEKDYIKIELPDKGFEKLFTSFTEEIYEVKASRFQVYYYALPLAPFKKDSVYCKPFETTELRIKF
jgi:hypothetical protein